ncbi:MAG TPA: flagellar assembly protein FliX [Candidatus Cybelea sp.]|nr:flagellar assembly protein FliX [Candidatus Cybelea sp.]
MKVEPTAPRPATSVRKTGGGSSASGAGGFAKALSDSQPAHSPQMPVSVGFADLNAVLALQEAPDATTRNRARQRAKERGSLMLDHLEEIRLGLLMGSIPVAKLEQLAQLVRAKREQLDDPKLLAILDEIEVRAAVELAKLSRPGSGTL